MTASASQIEREVEASRANLEDTVEALKDKMSVGQVFNEASRYLGDNGGAEILANLASQARANPIPLALVGVGLAWLMSGRGQPHLASVRSRGGVDRDYESLSGDEYRRRFAASSAYEGVSHPDYPGAGSGYRSRSSFRRNSGGMFDSMGRRIHDVRDAASGAASGIGSVAGGVASGVAGAASTVASGIGAIASGIGSAASTIGSAASTVGSAASSAASTVGAAASTVGSVASQAGRTVYSAAGSVVGGTRSGAQTALQGGSSMYRSASHLGSDAYRGASYYGRGARRTFSDVLDSEPLIIGALGLAVGAAIGALLPRTETEDRYLGGTRDRLAEDAGAFAREKFEQGKAVASDLYQAAKEEAEAHGLTTTDEGSVVARVTEAAKATVERARETAAEKGLVSGSYSGTDDSDGDAVGGTDWNKSTLS